MALRRLTAADILTAQDTQTLDLEVPEWGGVVKLRTLTAAEAMDFVEAFRNDKKNSAVEVMVLSCVDDEGKPLFTRKDMEQLKQRNLRAMNRVQQAVMELNGLADSKATKEAAKKDSGEAVPGDSPTASPAS